MRRLILVVVAVFATTLLTACGPESCGRKDISRYKPGGVVEHCEESPDGSGLHWRRES